MALALDVSLLWRDAPVRWGMELAVLVSAGLAAYLGSRSSRLGARLPRVAAAAWPHLPLYSTLGVLVLELLILLVLSTATAWTALESYWGTLVHRAPTLQHVSWLWLWLPVLLVYALVCAVAARFLSRRYFHLTLVTLMLCAIRGALFHREPHPPPAPASASSVDARPPCPGTSGRLCALLETRQSTVGQPPPTFPRFLEHGPRTGREAAVSLPGRGGSWSAPRPLATSAHQPLLLPGRITLMLMGVGLLLCYRWLRALNAQYATLPIDVGPIHDERAAPAQDGDGGPSSGAQGGPEGQRRPELERLLRETLHKNALHTPPRIPGGSLLYWRELLETEKNERLGWFTQLIALLLRVAVPPHGLQVSGRVVTRPALPGSQGLLQRALATPVPSPDVEQGLRFSIRNLRTHRVEVADTYWTNGAGLERVVRRAAYTTSEIALELCPSLVEWTYWHERDGKAVSHYWAGVDAFQARPFHLEFFEKANMELALRHFEAGAKRSHGNAMARLQYGQVHEAKGNFALAADIYSELGNRYPHMVVARFRLALVCGFVDRWAEPHLKNPQQREDVRRLLHSLWASSAFKRFQERRREPPAGRVGLDWCDKRHVTVPGKGDAEEVRHLRACLHEFAIHQLGELARINDWDAVGWCLCNVAERRRLGRTLLWTPGWRRASHHSVQAALCCVRLRECLLQAPEVTGKLLLNAGRDESCREASWKVALHSRVLKGDEAWAQEVRECLRQCEHVAREADSAHRRRPDGWGMVHYNLACFYALCLMPAMDPGFTGVARSKRREQRWRIPDDESAWHYWACQSVRHLSSAMKDPRGPIGQGNWWWLVRDPDLRALRRHSRYAHWKEWVELKGEDRDEDSLANSIFRGTLSPAHH